MDYFKRIFNIFINGDFSDEGKQAFNKWLVDEDFSEEKNRILDELWINTEADADSSIRRSWKTFKRNALINKDNDRIKLLRIWQSAAAVLLLLTISILFYTYQLNNKENFTDLIEQYTPVSTTERLILSDGSEVYLNSGSLLLYPEKFAGNSRSVYLSGEANFKVKEDKDKPFIVKTNDFKVTVLGTEFDLLAYPEDSIVSVTLLSGSVEASYNNLNEKTVLTPNKQLVYNKKSRNSFVHSPNIEDVTAWQRGELIFKGTTLGEVIKVLRHKYPYDFVYHDERFIDDKYTFKFKDDAPLKEVMEIISQVVGYIEYNIESDKCYIEPKRR